MQPYVQGWGCQLEATGRPGKVEEVLRGDAQQSCIGLILCHLNGRNRGPIHPAKGLEIAAIIENGYVLADAKFSGFSHCCIHHFLCQLKRNAVFLDHVSHWTFPPFWYVLRFDHPLTVVLLGALRLAVRCVTITHRYSSPGEWQLFPIGMHSSRAILLAYTLLI